MQVPSLDRIRVGACGMTGRTSVLSLHVGAPGNRRDAVLLSLAFSLSRYKLGAPCQDGEDPFLSHPTTPCASLQQVAPWGRVFVNFCKPKGCSHGPQSVLSQLYPVSVSWEQFTSHLLKLAEWVAAGKLRPQHFVGVI